MLNFPEVKVIDKVFNFINVLFPKEIEKASKEYQETAEAQFAPDKKIYARGLFS